MPNHGTVALEAGEVVVSADGYIVEDEGIMGGTPCIRGTRMTVYSVLGRVDHGDTIDEIAEENPDIPREAWRRRSSTRAPTRW
jgi:uncharacterized protein (DUF433 family)